MNAKELINKMVTELAHNHRKYSDGCGDINYDLLAHEIASRLRLMGRNDIEAPEWIWDCAVTAAETHKKNRKQERQLQV